MLGYLPHGTNFFLEMKMYFNISHLHVFFSLAECRNAFALICRNNSEFKEKLYSFTIDCDETKKIDFLTALSKNMANTMCRADYVSIFCHVGLPACHFYISLFCSFFFFHV